MSVDLPAPFSPTSPCTSPRLTDEVDVVQRNDAGKALADAAHREDRLRSRY